MIDDRVVDARDAMVEWNQVTGIAPPTVFADINGDGVVSNTDYNLVRVRNKTTLPPFAI